VLVSARADPKGEVAMARVGDDRCSRLDRLAEFVVTTARRAA
jgi:hypothetical protein